MLRKASPAARRARAPVSRARSDPAAGQFVHRGVVQEIGRRDGCQLHPLQGLIRIHPVAAEGLHGAAQGRHGGGVSVGHPDGAALEQEIHGRVRWLAGRWQVSRHPRDPLQERGPWWPSPANTDASSAESSASLAARGASVCSRCAAVNKVAVASATSPRAYWILPRGGWPAPGRADTDHTLEEVGQQFSVTRERIRQIEAKALRKLKHPSRSRKLRSFLDN